VIQTASLVSRRDERLAYLQPSLATVVLWWLTKEERRTNLLEFSLLSANNLSLSWSVFLFLSCFCLFGYLSLLDCNVYLLLSLSLFLSCACLFPPSPLSASTFRTRVERCVWRRLAAKEVHVFKAETSADRRKHHTDAQTPSPSSDARALPILRRPRTLLTLFIWPRVEGT